MTTEETVEKRPLVLWSGGFDSTALVISLLHDGDIDVLYVSLDNNSAPQKYEKKAIKKLKRIIVNAKLKGSIINEHAFGYGYIDVRDNMYSQPALWVHAAAFVADSEIHSTVEIAYIKHDDAWHFKTEIQDAYAALTKLICFGITVPLSFPFEWRTKASLLEDLQDVSQCDKILKAVRYCEGREAAPCGECASCKRHISELHTAPRLISVDMTNEVVSRQETENLKETENVK